MHARIAIYRLTSGKADDVAAKAERGMLPIFREQPGFVSYRLVAAEDDDKIVSVSRWQSHEQAEEAALAAENWVRENIAGILVLEDNYVGDVLVSSD